MTSYLTNIRFIWPQNQRLYLFVTFLVLFTGCKQLRINDFTPNSASECTEKAHASPQQTTSIKRGDHLYVFSANALSNLTYQLDCMAGLMPCSSEAFSKLWKSELSWDREDDERLARWKALRRSYDAFIQNQKDLDASKTPLVTPARSSGFLLSKRLRINSYTAGDIDTFLRNTELLTTEQNARELGEIISEFRPRFILWWEKNGAPAAEAFLRDGPKVFDSYGIADLTEKLIAFYEADLPSSKFWFHCIVRPNYPGFTSGEQIGNHSVVEMRVTSGVVDHVTVMVHEICHYLFSNMRANRFIVLEKLFANSLDAKSMVGHGFLDEALATAWGNGFVGRKVMSETEFSKLLSDDNGLYANKNIHAIAKALLPYIEEYLNKTTVLSSEEFLDDYLKAVHEALPGGCSAVMYLQEIGVVAASDFSAAARKLVKLTSAWKSDVYTPVNLTSLHFLSEYPFLSSVLLLKPEDLSVPGLEDVLGHESMQEITNIAQTNDSFIYAVPRTLKSYTFVIVANSVDVMDDLVKRLLSAEEVQPGRLTARL